MLHHVALEVSPGAIADEARFWVATGFAEAPVPEALGAGFVWFERDGTQIHLIHVEEPIVPRKGHVAVVAPDFEATVQRLRGFGFEVRPGRELWGAARAKATSPGGHTVELMASPPASSTD